LFFVGLTHVETLFICSKFSEYPKQNEIINMGYQPNIIIYDSVTPYLYANAMTASEDTISS
jgi:hypothetical protein